MVMLLHEVEALKSFVVDSIRATDKLMNWNNKKEHKLPEGTKNLFKKAWKFLVREKIITQEESDNIQNIIDIRNRIGHQIHTLTADISISGHCCPVNRNKKGLNLNELLQ